MSLHPVLYRLKLGHSSCVLAPTFAGKYAGKIIIPYSGSAGKLNYYEVRRQEKTPPEPGQRCQTMFIKQNS